MVKMAKQNVKANKVKQDWINVPNILSIIRMMIVPLFVILFFRGDNGSQIGAFVVLLISGFTDFLDGVIARKYNLITDLGKLLDPMADKITQAVVGICMMIEYFEYISIVILFAMFFLKELLMAIGGLVLYEHKVKSLPGARWFGKIATASFYFSICTIILCKVAFNFHGLWLIWILVGITGILMLNAFIRYYMMFREICQNGYVIESEQNAKAE